MDTVSLIRGNLGRPALPKEKRIYFMTKKLTVLEDGILFSDGDPVPFEFKLESTTKNPLIDSYVGVDFSIVFKVSVVLKRKDGMKPLEALGKFDCKLLGGGIDATLGRSNKSQDFSITPDALPEDPKNKGKALPRFNFSG